MNAPDPRSVACLLAADAVLDGHGYRVPAFVLRLVTNAVLDAATRYDHDHQPPAAAALAFKPECTETSIRDVHAGHMVWDDTDEHDQAFRQVQAVTRDPWRRVLHYPGELSRVHHPAATVLVAVDPGEADRFNRGTWDMAGWGDGRPAA